MVCYNNYAQPAAENNSCGGSILGCGEKGFSCIINLIIILVVLQFLTNILCSTTCDMC